MVPDWNEKLLFGAGRARSPCAQVLRLYGVFRTSHRPDSVLRLRASLAPGKFKHAELMAWRRVCRHHFEAAPQLDRPNLAGLNLEHVAQAVTSSTGGTRLTDPGQGGFAKFDWVRLPFGSEVQYCFRKACLHGRCAIGFRQYPCR